MSDFAIRLLLLARLRLAEQTFRQLRDGPRADAANACAAILLGPRRCGPGSLELARVLADRACLQLAMTRAPTFTDAARVYEESRYAKE